MRNFISLLLLSFFTIVANAQQSVFPPLGIVSEVPRLGSPGSVTYDQGREGGARNNAWDGVYPKNKDATRFLEKAVAENNVENAKKFLQAGASAYISYEMIDKKQYEMIDVMYKDNPKLIRFSQLLHYACANSNPEMIDFLIERNASLDLNGYYVKYGHNSAQWGFFVMCKWNEDAKYQYTPADCALLYNKWNNLNHIMNKYHKYPTIYGCSALLGLNLMNDKQGKGVKLVREFLLGNVPFLKNVNYTIVDVINFGYHYLNRHNLKTYFLLTGTVEKIAKSRVAKDGRDKEYIDLLNLMISKGVNVNPQDDQGAYWRSLKSFGINNVSSYVNNTPMYVAVTNPSMLDIVKLLMSNGASTTTTANGQKVSIATLPEALDEYKEYFMLEGIQ